MRKRKERLKKKRKSIARSGIGKRPSSAIKGKAITKSFSQLKEKVGIEKIRFPKVKERVQNSILGRFFRRLRGE